MAVALQVREIILGMPSEVERIKRSVTVSNDNLVEYRKQLAAENPYTNDLDRSRTRLDEINGIIKEHSKQMKRPKKKKPLKIQLRCLLQPILLKM